MSSAISISEESDDTLVRNSRTIRTDWINVAFKLIVAISLLEIARVPYAPLIVSYLIGHEFVITWLRKQLAMGNTEYKPLYLLTIFVTVVFWTGLACWLWFIPGLLMKTGALGILFSAPMLGAIRGYRDTSFVLATCALPLITTFALTFGSMSANMGPSSIILALAPLTFGVVVILRSVRSLRRRDERIRKADADRSRLMAELEQSRSHLERVTELSGVAGWEIEFPSRVCKLSTGARKLLAIGTVPDSLDDLLAHFTQESAVEFQVALGNARKQGKSVDVVAQMKAQADVPRWIRLVGTVARDNDHDSRFVGAMQDLSDRISQIERERIEEVSNALSRLSARTASEFKKDLNEVSRSLAELGRRARNGTMEHMLVQGMRLSLNRALDTAQSLQAFGRSNLIEPGVININKCVNFVANATSRLMPAGQTLVVNSDGPELHAMLDAGELDLALLHLILNARDAMDEGGEITITTGMTVDMWPFIEIRDTGRGIRPDLQPMIFEPFYSTKRAQGARGMGLSIVRGFVDQAKGRLDVRSEPGAGSTFRLSFPPVSAQALIETKRADASPGKTVLAVLENQTTFDTLAPVLQDHGFALELVASAKDGLSRMDGCFRFEGVLMSGAQARSLAGQALAARMQRNCPQTPLLVLLPATEDAETLPPAAQTIAIDSVSDGDVAGRIAELLNGKNLSTRPA